MKADHHGLRPYLSEVIAGWLDLAWPDCCLLCGRHLSAGEEYVCLNCLYELPGAELDSFRDNAAAQRFMGKIPFEKAATAFRYVKDSNLQKALELLKYKGERGLGEQLGRYAANRLQKVDFLDDIDLLVPVPLHPAREKKRGYNQSGAIAEGLSACCGIPVDIRHLHRTTANKSQTTKSLWERWENTRWLFGTHHPEELAGKHLLLVDDVLTSGSTMEACGRCLLSAADVRLSFFALALA